MPVSLASYRISPGEKPASSSKQNNMLTALENALNALPPSQIVGYPSNAAMFLNGSGAWSNVPTDLAARYVKTTTTNVVSSNVETDLFGGAFTIAANALPASGAIKIWAGGDYLNNTAASRTFILVLKLGAQVLWQVSSSALGINAIRRAWDFQAVIQAMGSTANQMASGSFISSPGQAATVGTGPLLDPSQTTGFLLAPFLSAATTVNMTASQALTFSVTHVIADANLSMRCFYARVEVST